MALGGCPYYFQYVPDDRQVIDLPQTAIPYCAHKHSPATREFVLYAVGGSQILRCGGDITINAKSRLISGWTWSPSSAPATVHCRP